MSYHRQQSQIERRLRSSRRKYLKIIKVFIAWYITSFLLFADAEERAQDEDQCVIHQTCDKTERAQMFRHIFYGPCDYILTILKMSMKIDFLD
jgi:hypothetical protein